MAKQLGKRTERKMDLYFRKGKEKDLAEISDSAASAILHMENSGIMQWDELYPAAEDFTADIAAGQLYVGLTDDHIAVIYILNQRDPSGRIFPKSLCAEII